MPNRNKERGTRFEHEFKWVLQMLSFYAIRAYASIGVADLVFTPPWNIRGNDRPLLVQCKAQQNKDYIRPIERDHLDYLQQINSGQVIVAYKDNSKVMIKKWESGERLTFEKFIQEEYGIRCKYSELLSKYKTHNRPIHLYYVDRDSNDKPLGSFQDFESVGVWYPHTPEHFRDKHI